MKAISIFLSGLLFGAGVTISGMVNPMNVLNFMDVTGAFDPTLIFVMGGGLIVTLIGYHFILRRTKPLFDSQYHLPSQTLIDTKLVLGAVLFGLGWGLAGFCPGPAIASLVFGYSQSFIFVGTMIIGIVIANYIARDRSLD